MLTVARANTDLGCIYPANTDPCDDANACTDGDICSAGSCTAGPPLVCVDDGDPCTIESCDEILGCSSQPDPACEPFVPDVPSSSGWGIALLVGMLLAAGLLAASSRKSDERIHSAPSSAS